MSEEFGDITRPPSPDRQRGLEKVDRPGVLPNGEEVALGAYRAREADWAERVDPLLLLQERLRPRWSCAPAAHQSWRAVVPALAVWLGVVCALAFLVRGDWQIWWLLPCGAAKELKLGHTVCSMPSALPPGGEADGKRIQDAVREENWANAFSAFKDVIGRADKISIWRKKPDSWEWLLCVGLKSAYECKDAGKMREAVEACVQNMPPSPGEDLCYIRILCSFECMGGKLYKADNAEKVNEGMDLRRTIDDLWSRHRVRLTAQMKKQLWCIEAYTISGLLNHSEGWWTRRGMAPVGKASENRDKNWSRWHDVLEEWEVVCGRESDKDLWQMRVYFWQIVSGLSASPLSSHETITLAGRTYSEKEAEEQSEAYKKRLEQ